MQELLLPIFAVVAGLAALVKGADTFVRGAADGARLLHVPPLLVGMVVVGFGTSAPELTVSAISAWRGAPELALGNAFGSNICNIALILGLCASVRPLAVKRGAWRFDLPVLLAVTLGSEALLALGGMGPGLSRPESFVLLAFFAVAMFATARKQMAAEVANGNASTANPTTADGTTGSLLAAVARVAVGLVALVLSSRALVWGAVEIARSIGVSDLIIGLTVIAIGTSLPELASSLAAVFHGEDDLAVGNILGSNLFNTLAVVGLSGAIRPMPTIDAAIVRRDVPLSLLLAIAIFALGRPRHDRDGRLGRVAGAVFLAVYVAYVTALVRAA